MKIIKGYGPTNFTCGVCGGNYICIESTDEPDLVKLRCWCGSTCEGPRDDDRVVSAIGPAMTESTAPTESRENPVNDQLAPSAEDEAFTKGLGSELTQEERDRILAPLTEQEREVLRLRFGLDRGASRSWEDIGNQLELERDEVRRIEARAMRKLRSPLMSPEA